MRSSSRAWVRAAGVTDFGALTLGAGRPFSARRRNASKVLMGVTAITVYLLAFAAARQHAPCRLRDAQEIVESLGTTFLEFPYLLQQRVSPRKLPWTLTDACVVIE